MTHPPPITFVHPSLREDSRLADFPVFRRGHEVWGVQVPLTLREAGLPIRTSGVLPESGIVVLHRDLIPDEFEPDGRFFLVAARGDRRPHPRVNAEVVLNPVAAVHAAGQRRHYMPLLPQQNLIPRDPARGDHFETLLFMGARENVDPMLESPEFTAFLRGRGIEFRPEFRPEHWHDFSQADAIVAVRPASVDDLRKPASKLINAWLAGLPAILGPESAFLHFRRSEADYLEASTPAELQAAVARLADDVEFRRRMAANARERAAEFTAPATVERWRRLLEDDIVPHAARWFASPLERRLHAVRCDLAASRSHAAKSGLRAGLAHMRQRAAGRRRGDWSLVPGAPPPGTAS